MTPLDGSNEAGLPEARNEAGLPEVLSLIRFSTAEQISEGKAGIEGQRKVNKASAAYHGVFIRKEILLVDVSGQDVMHNAKCQEMLREMTDPTLSGVLTAEQSRIVRPETFDDYPILGHFQRNKKLIYTPTGKIDPNTPEGRTALSFGCMMSGEELHTLKSRWARGKNTKRIDRQHVSGDQALPKGVRYVRDRNPQTGKIEGWRWETDPVETQRMRRAFLLLIEGDSYEECAEKVGGGWTGNGLRRAMQNPIWVGIRRYMWEAVGQRRPVKAKPETYAKHEPGWEPKWRRKLEKRKVPMDVPTREELVAGTAKPIIEPILSWEEWDRAQEIITARITKHRKSKLKNANRERFLALKVCECSCGLPLYPRYGSRGKHLDACYCKSRFKGGPGCGAQSIKRADLDACIESVVTSMITADFLMAALKAAIKLQKAAPDPARVERERKLAKLATGRKNLLGALAAGEIERPEFREQMAALEREVKALEAQVPAPVPEADPAQVVALVAMVFAEFVHLAFADKQALLRSAVKRIIVDGHARTITTVTLNGGYLGMGANSVLRSRGQSQICAIPDLTIRFPEPIVIPDTYINQHEVYLASEANRQMLARGRSMRWKRVQ